MPYPSWCRSRLLVQGPALSACSMCTREIFIDALEVLIRVLNLSSQLTGWDQEELQGLSTLWKVA